MKARTAVFFMLGLIASGNVVFAIRVSSRVERLEGDVRGLTQALESRSQVTKKLSFDPWKLAHGHQLTAPDGSL